MMLLGRAARSKSPVRTLSVHATVDSGAAATGGNDGLVMPSTVQFGDLAVILGCAVGGASGSTDAGWTLALYAQSGSGATRLYCAFKILDGSEADQTYYNYNGSPSNKAVLLVFRGDSPIRMASAHDAVGEVLDGDPATQICDAGDGSSPLVVLGVWATGTSGLGDTRVFTPSPDATVGVGSTVTHEVKYKVYNSAPADTTVDIGDWGALITAMGSFYVEVS